MSGYADHFLREKAETREALFQKVQRKPLGNQDVYASVVIEHPIGGQLTTYPDVKTSLLNRKRQFLPPLPTHISEVAKAILNEQWASDLGYGIVVADTITGATEKTVHKIQAWAINIDRMQMENGVYLINYTESPIVVGVPGYAEKFVLGEAMFLASTYDSVPNVDGAYQLLTVHIECKGEVIKNIVNTVGKGMTK